MNNQETINLIGKRLKECRMEKALTQKDASEKIPSYGCSISKRTIQRAENGESLLRGVTKWLAIAKCYNVSIESFFDISIDCEELSHYNFCTVENDSMVIKMESKAIGEKLRKMREEKDLSRDKVLDGMIQYVDSFSYAMLQRAENGKLFHDITKWLAVAQYYNVSIESLFDVSKDNTEA